MPNKEEQVSDARTKSGRPIKKTKAVFRRFLARFPTDLSDDADFYEQSSDFKVSYFEVIQGRNL